MSKYHFIGIGGIGMSGLARLLLGKKALVSGSDIAASAMTETLIREGANVHIGHSAQHIVPDATVVFSTDIKKDNPEYQAALKLKCPMLHRSELLQKIMENYQGLAIAGTHGKTTTSSLLAWVLEKSGQSPSYAIGGVVPQLASNAGQGSGKYFVAEACESDGTFLNYTPYGAIVTNIDGDHLDHYGSEQALIKAFKQFMEQVKSPEHLFWCGEDAHLKKLQAEGKGLRGISYGFGDACALKASNFLQSGWMIQFDATFKGKTYPKVEVSLTGRHNALNALAVFGLALSLGIDEAAVRSALRTFGGVLRRCEKKGDVHGVLFLDDYGHHPTELKATLSAIRGAIGERRLIVVYQPHRYTRAKECIGLYGNVFDLADEVFITEIYSAREAPIPGVSHETIVQEVKASMKERCQHVERAKVADKLAAYVRPHDVVVSLGAGDVTKLSGELIEKLRLKAPAKLKVGLIFGGMSVEHEISLLSSANIEAGLRAEYYDVEDFGITREGVWLHGKDAMQKLKSGAAVNGASKMTSEVLAKLLQCDILFPVLHGTYGEDGTIQGFFEIFSKAYVGCDYRSSAISMDKELTKRLLNAAGIPTLPFIACDRHEWNTSPESIMKRVDEELTYPVFVKPVHLGSSIGVHKVVSREKLQHAINDAFRFDNRLLIENGADRPREIEFSVLGNDELTVFPPGEILTNGQVYDYDRKYGLNPSVAPMGTSVKAALSVEKIAEGMALAKAAFKAVGGQGMARVDTFLDAKGNFWLNEINPIPGFTKTSLYPLMCNENGLATQDLIDRLIVLGLQRRRALDRLEVKP